MNTYSYITVIPSECKVIVDGVAYVIPFLEKDARLNNIHAIQWPGKAPGHIELQEAIDGVSYYPIDDKDYQTIVAPYVALWEKQAALINEHIEKLVNSDKYKIDKLLHIREKELDKTDYIVLPDYVTEPAIREKAVAYRKWLRDMTKLPGYPWDGGGKETPWPEAYPWVGK